MSKDLIAKKYAKALLDSNDSQVLSNVLSSLNEILPAFCNEKFNNIIDSQDVTQDQKIDFVLSLPSYRSFALENFIKLLGEKKRLSLIPEIVKILNNEISASNNCYTGVVFSKIPLDNYYLSDLSSKLSYKFNKNITLSYIQNDYDGIKVDIEGLGVEIGFSKDRFKKSVAEHILKAV